jgi:hypothetical protein
VEEFSELLSGIEESWIESGLAYVPSEMGAVD